MNTTIAARGVGTTYDPAIAAAAYAAGLDVALVKAVIAVESAWNPGAINAGDPSYGLMQVNTRAHPDVTPAQMLDPAANIAYGTAYLGSQLARYGDPGGISAYNAGTPISGNAGYVAEVQAYRAWYAANDPASGMLTDWTSSVVNPGGGGGSGLLALDLGAAPDLGTVGGVSVVLLLVVGLAWLAGRGSG